MAYKLDLLLVNTQTGEIFLREVDLPINKTKEINPFEPQFICEIPKGDEVHILGID